MKPQEVKSKSQILAEKLRELGVISAVLDRKVFEMIAPDIKGKDLKFNEITVVFDGVSFIFKKGI